MKRHPTDWLSFLSGLLFVAVGTVVMLAVEAERFVTVRWMIPAAAVIVGVSIVVGVVGRGSERTRAAIATPPGNPATPEALAELEREVPKPE